MSKLFKLLFFFLCYRSRKIHLSCSRLCCAPIGQFFGLHLFGAARLLLYRCYQSVAACCCQPQQEYRSDGDDDDVGDAADDGDDDDDEASDSDEGGDDEDDDDDCIIIN